MGILPNLLDLFAKPKLIENNKTRIHIEDCTAVTKLSNKLVELLDNCKKRDVPLVICIGTDRSTGDCLGPLTGSRLSSLLAGSGIRVLGTIDDPIHAQNLEQHLKEVTINYRNNPVVAVDACLGPLSNVGSILLEQSPLKPGAGVHKTLPAVGDISVSGVVNVGGFMEIQVLQNTRLSIVMKMSQVIVNSIFLAMQKKGYLN